jgi:hypothetical protein
MMFVRRSNARHTTPRLKIVDIIQAALDILNDDEEDSDLVTQDSALAQPPRDESSQVSSDGHS